MLLQQMMPVLSLRYLLRDVDIAFVIHGYFRSFLFEEFKDHKTKILLVPGPTLQIQKVK